MLSYDVFPNSLVLHFPPDVYQNTWFAKMRPQPLEILKPEELQCVQFLRDGKVYVSFKEKAVCDKFLSEGLFFADVDISVTRHAEKVTSSLPTGRF